MTGITNIIRTEKQYLLHLQAAILLVSVLLGVFILTDVRLNILGEPFGDHLMAISIAISRLVYGVEGLAGLEQILETLKQIPNVSLINLDNITAYENYHSVINETLQKSTLLDNIDYTQLHAYVNDQTYLYYVITAFYLFGIKIQSLSFLWLLAFYATVILYLASYRKSIPQMIALWILLIPIILVVIANPGVGNQLITVYNYRFIPVLGLIPLLHVIFAVNNSDKTVIDWVCLLIQIMILVFVMLVRGSAQWMMVAIALFTVWSLWQYGRNRFSGNMDQTNITKSGIYLRTIFPFFLVLVLFILTKTSTHSFLHEEYKSDIWTQSHVIWHAAVIGLTVDPVLYSGNVCTNKPLHDRLKGFRPLICDVTTKRYTRPRLWYGIFDQPSDMHGFHAAVRYLRERGSTEQIGTEPQGNGYFNIDWDRYDGIMQKVYFQMLWNNPLDSLYMYIIAKPLKYLKEATMYLKYFRDGFLGAGNRVSLAIFILFVTSLYYYFATGFRNFMVLEKSFTKMKENKLLIIFAILFISSLAPSILFYSQAHTIADSIIVFLALCFLSPIIYYQSIKNGISELKKYKSRYSGQGESNV